MSNIKTDEITKEDNDSQDDNILSSYWYYKIMTNEVTEEENNSQERTFQDDIELYKYDIMVDVYIDNNGYERYFKNDQLLHRNLARLYLYGRCYYKLEFFQYVIHHIDGDKLNNNIINLAILTKEEHEEIHQINYDDEDDDEDNTCEDCGKPIKNKYICCYNCNKELY